MLEKWTAIGNVLSGLRASQGPLYYTPG